MPQQPLGSHKHAKSIKAPPTAMEAMEARLSLLKTLTTAPDGKTKLSRGQRLRRESHILEKAQIESKIEKYNNRQTLGRAASASTQPSVASEPDASPLAIVTNTSEGQSKNTLAAQTITQRLADINIFVHERPARPLMTTNNGPTPHSFPSPNSQTRLPLRPIQSRKRDKSPIVSPSAASGGVPEPSKTYMSTSAMEPQAASMPQHLLLVIDLNGTLLYRPSKHRPYVFVERPSAQPFLSYALLNFSVMIWSSAQPGNVDRMCDKLFSKESRQKLLAVWGRDRLGLSAADSKKRVQVYKRLERVWCDPKIQSQHPLASEGKGWHQGNTVLIDDSVEKSRSEPHNFLQVSEFTGHEVEDPNALKDLAEYLAILRMQTNVSSYILRNPFVCRKQPD